LPGSYRNIFYNTAEAWLGNYQLVIAGRNATKLPAPSVVVAWLVPCKITGTSAAGFPSEVTTFPFTIPLSSSLKEVALTVVKRDISKAKNSNIGLV
jgi:hypothetical protein